MIETLSRPDRFLGLPSNFLAVLTVSLLFELTLVTDAQREIPALGRPANLGYLYGEVEGNPLLTVFSRENIPREFKNEVQMPQETIETGITNSYADAFSLLDIDSNTGVNILAGLTKPRGSAAILKDISKYPNEVTGTLIYKYQTVAQSLIYNEGLIKYVNMEVIRHLNATHVVTGVLWGTTVAVTFQKSPTNNLTRETITDTLKNYFKNFNLRFSPSFELENELNFTITVKSDIALPSGFQATFSDLRKLLKEVPEIVKTINEGKGVPLEYTLTPLADFRSHLKLPPSPADSKFLKTRLRDFTLKRFISLFDDFAVSHQGVSELRAKLLSQVNCLTDKSREEIDAIHAGIAESKELFKEALQNLLVKTRSGSTPTSSTLSELAQEYAQGNFSLKAVESKLQKLNKLVTKIDFCQQVKKLYPNVEYFGKDGDLVSVMNQKFDKNVYILYTKTEFSQTDPIKYAEKLQLFFKTLNTNNNSLVILDCDFNHIRCQNLTETTIQKYSNGQLTGPLFEVTIDACAGPQNPCMNGGICADEVDGFSCDCNPQFFGKRCQQQRRNPCQNHGCLNNTTCIPSSNYWDYSCNCSAGFTGKNCEININECTTNVRTCLNGGTCVDGTNHFTCTCPPGYVGDICEVFLPPTCPALQKAARNTLPVVAVESQNPCMNGGRCADDIDGFSCACKPQWFGKRCQHELNPCQNHRCLNNATCIPSSNNWDYSCNCSAGFTGQNCEINIDECATNRSACLNGGTCVDSVNRFTCTCPPGYAGALCEVTLPPPPTCPALEKAARNTLPVVTVGCGGLINMPGLLSNGSFLVDFKSSSWYKKEEQCLWTFDNVKDEYNYWLNVTVTLLCEGFLNSNGVISVVDWKTKGDDWMPSHHRLTHKGHMYETISLGVTYRDRKLFLRFTSRDALGSGFLVLVDILRADPWHKGSNFVHTVSPGSAAYSPFVFNSYSSYTSIVINPQQQQRLTLTVDYFEFSEFRTEILDDALDIYEIPPTNPPRRLQRIGQNLTSPASFSSEFPILATMFTYQATAGKGFRLTWK